MQDAFSAAGEGKVKMPVIHGDVSFILPSSFLFLFIESCLLLGWGNTEFQLLDIQVAFSWWILVLLYSELG